MRRATRPTIPAPSPALAAPSAPDAETAARAVLATLAVLAAARALFAFVPGTSAWGLHLLRFAPALPGWAAWLLAAVALVPAFATRAERALPKPLRTSAPGPWAALVWGCAAAAIAWTFPDQTRFVGDSILRHNALHAPPDFAALNPQAFLADRWLHDDLPRWLAAHRHLDTHDAARVMGALEAAVLAWTALAAARVLGATGTRAWAVAALVLGTAAYGLFTGYSKSLMELAIAAAAVGVAGLRLLRTGKGPVVLGLACAAGIAFHRLGLGLLPACAMAFVLRPAPADARGPGRWALAAGVAAPVVALACVAHDLARILPGLDVQNFRGAGGAAGPLSGAWSGVRLLDALNMVLCVAPLAPLVVLAPAVRPSPRWREGVFLLALALPWLLVLPLFHPPIGMVRNWDVFAPLGVVLALAAAWVVTNIPAAAPASRALGLAVTLNAFAPALVALLHHADVDAGLARARALIDEAPRRDAIERASAWDFLANRESDLGRLDEAARDFAGAAALTPSPRILRQWATVEGVRGRPQAAREVLREVVRRNPADARTWMVIARLSWSLGDTLDARRALDAALRAAPGTGAARAASAAAGDSLPRP